MIEQLPSLTPDATRHARTLARCHERLALRRQWHEPDLERNALLGFGLVYLSSLAFVAVQVLIAH